MKAVVIENYGGNDQIKIKDVPTPEPQANEVQVQVAYAGVNPMDWKIREGYLRELLPHQLPIILGWDASGTVTKVGKDVSNVKVGDQVIVCARKLVVKHGCFAEYVCVDAKNVAAKPANMSLKEAAVIPLVGLAAWQTLVEFAKVQPQETVLIHAGAGGVGSLAIQIAKNAGAKVLATANTSQQEYVKGLGADVVIDYTAGNFADKVKEIAPEGVDVVLDTVGDETLEASFPLVKKGGRLVSIRQQIDPSYAEKFGIKTGFIFTRHNGNHLKAVVELLSNGKIKAHPAIQEFPLDKAGEALEKVREGHTQGKVVLKVK